MYSRTRCPVTFATEQACVSYAAGGGTLVGPFAGNDLCEQQPGFISFAVHVPISQGLAIWECKIAVGTPTTGTLKMNCSIDASPTAVPAWQVFVVGETTLPFWCK
jgi:hypothetical protein